MSKYIVLIKFTERGIANINQSPARAQAFRAAAEKAGVKASVYWTLGPYDGVLMLDAPDEQAATGAILGLARQGNVTTCMCRAFDAEEFQGVLSKMT